MQGLMRRALSLAAACVMTTALCTAPALALEQIKMSIFQSNFCCFAVYVAKHLKLFEKHGVDVELVYGTGIHFSGSCSMAYATFLNSCCQRRTRRSSTSTPRPGRSSTVM